MEPKVCRILGLFLLGVAAGQLFPSDLTCNVEKQADGLFIYQLSQPPKSSEWETWWEIQNKTVIARDHHFNRTLVQNLTSKNILLKDCREDVRYGKVYEGVYEEADCRVNCSQLLDDVSGQTTVNSTLTCVFGSWCPEPQTIIVLGIVLLLVPAAVFGGLTLWKLVKRRIEGSAAQTTSYTPANEQIKMVGV